MKNKTKNDQGNDSSIASKTSSNGTTTQSSGKAPTKEFEKGQSKKPGEKKEKRLGESETEIDDETTI